MPDPTVIDLRRELAKAEETLIACLRHLSSHAEMNAALHCSERVMYSPLHAKVEATIDGLARARMRTDEPADNTMARSLMDTQDLVKILTDLDRCQHGRHQGDPCGPADDCDGTSAGNPHLRPGDVIGYGVRGDRIVMPERDDKHDPAAWRPGSEATP
ncbi:hypothetical protein [Streptomyces sp.]|uniref:hypothetical protein n=1 Tax=Streptomyces sp. TaxID=1931 RepID=UPI0028123718|nr:hypothetical protein [Streptomyces sp.]